MSERVREADQTDASREPRCALRIRRCLSRTRRTARIFCFLPSAHVSIDLPGPLVVSLDGSLPRVICLAFALSFSIARLTSESAVCQKTVRRLFSFSTNTAVGQRTTRRNVPRSGGCPREKERETRLEIMFAILSLRRETCFARKSRTCSKSQVARETGPAVPGGSLSSPRFSTANNKGERADA